MATSHVDHAALVHNLQWERRYHDAASGKRAEIRSEFIRKRTDGQQLKVTLW